jgi:hypothetical protein
MQQKQTTLLLLCLIPWLLQAQPCGTPQSQIDMFGNALRVRLLNNNTLGNDLLNAVFEPNTGPQPGQVPSTIFAAGLWYGGIAPNGSLKFNAPAYNSNGAGAFTGPLSISGATTSTDCSNWDRHFVVTRAEIEAFLTDVQDGNLSAPHAAIKGWPAVGNPFFSQIWGFDLPFSQQALAPFFDANGDNQYNPLDGDYPVVALRGKPFFVPETIIWSVTNDVGNGTIGTQDVGMEVQTTSFVFSCDQSPTMNNTLFTSYKMIYRGAVPIDSFSVGMYVDFDLGCFANDYVGAYPEYDGFFAYNATANDATGSLCTGTLNFGTTTPAQAVTFLDMPLTHFLPLFNSSVGNYPNATTDPTLAFQIYNCLNGHWKDGTPLTQGGTGYNPASSVSASHAFPNVPGYAGWSMEQANLAPTDVRGLGSSYIGELLPGAINELTVAWSFHQRPFNNNLQIADALRGELEQLQDLYDNNFESACSAIVAAKTPVVQGVLPVSPNPAASLLRVQLSQLPEGTLEVFHISGQSMLVQPLQRSEPLDINVAQWPNGVYLLRYRTEQGVWTQKVVVEK